METTPFDYTAAKRELSERVAAFLFNNKEITYKEAAALFNMTNRQVEYIARQHGSRRIRTRAKRGKQDGQ